MEQFCDSGAGKASHYNDTFDLDEEQDFVFIAVDDNLPKFLSLMNDLFNNPFPGQEVKPKLCPEEIMEDICTFGALDCATALLAGLPGVFLDLNIPFTSGRYPLHLAASQSNCAIVDLFLRHGARTDVEIVGNRSQQSKLLPLNVALESLHYHSALVDWTPKESIYKLVAILCLPEMRRALETSRLLALKTQGVDEVFRYYGNDGQLVEMAVLLMVAKDKISDQKYSEYGYIADGIMTARKSIRQEIDWLVDERLKARFFSVQRSKLLKLSATKRETLESALHLLELFEMAGDALRSYLQSQETNVTKEMVAKDVASILEKAGIILKDKDVDLSDITCSKSSNGESSKVTEAMGPLEKMRAYQSMYSGLELLGSTAWSCLEKQMPWRVRMPCVIAHEMREMGYRHGCSSQAGYRNSLISSKNRGSCTRSMSTVSAQSNGEKNPIVRPMFPFRSGKLLAFLGPLSKRGMRM